MNRLLLTTIAGLALACTSCGNPHNLYPVTGKVTWKGGPAVGATVFFHRQGGDRQNEHTIMGIVSQDGSFTLNCGPFGKGAPPGQYDVLIAWKRVSHQAKGQPQREPDRLKGRYADPHHPQLHAVVRAEPNELPPFELTD
jgi:hypothetical protein